VEILTTLLVAAALVASARAEPVGDDGATVFRQHCASCHGASGRSDTADARAAAAAFVRKLAQEP